MIGQRDSASSLDDVFHITRDEEYLRQLQAEAEHWGKPQLSILDLERPVLDRYFNKRFTGDENVAWFDTISRYGVFRRGCTLGAGALREEVPILRENPALHLTLYDISGESLTKRERELGSQFPGRVATCQADLNFVELPANAYDLIISAGCIHHLLNLEHIAYQINKALTPSGIFFLYDYVGEARFQFAREKKQLFEAFIEEARARHPFLRSWRVIWPDLSNWDHSPLEAVRSDETLEVFRRYLIESSLCSSGSVVSLLLWLKPIVQAPAPLRGWRRLLPGVRGQTMNLLDVHRNLASDLLWLDAATTDAGILQPCNAFAVYRKR